MKNTVQLHTASMLANSIMLNAIESGLLLGVHWPMEKEFAVVMTHSTWPVGWSNQYFVSFFDSEAEMLETFARNEEWALCEDNYFARRVYRWDWGPVEMREHSYNEFHVPTKRNQYMSVISDESYETTLKRKEYLAKLRAAATPREFNCTALSMYYREGLIPGEGEWPFVRLEKATSPLFITSTELARIQNASKDVNDNAPVVLSEPPKGFDDDNGYW